MARFVNYRSQSESCKAKLAPRQGAHFCLDRGRSHRGNTAPSDAASAVSLASNPHVQGPALALLHSDRPRGQPGKLHFHAQAARR